MGAAARPRIGAGDAVDREYESLMQELSGGAPVGNGAPPQRIEAGTGGQDEGDGHGGGRSLKPWQRGPTGAPAPWQQRRHDDGDGGSSRPWASGGRNYQQNYGGYDAGPPGGAAPWHQQNQQYGNYGGYPGFADQSYGYQGYGSQPPPPPGMGAMYPGYGNAGSPPPPPPGDEPPPPPPSDQPPPPPPS